MDWPSAIRKFRRRAGLKQQSLADMLGCDQTAISHWERGVDKPSLALQCRLAALIARDRRAFWDFYVHLDDKSSTVFREFGRADNKQLAREAFSSAAETVVIEAEITVKPEGANKAIRFRGLATPVVLLDSTIALRVELLPTDGDVDDPLKSQFFGIDDLEDE